MRAALVAVALLLLLPATAPARSVDLPAAFGDVLPEVKEKTEIPVLLPQRYRSDAEGHFPSGEGRRRGYTLSLAAVEQCGGATAIEWVEDDVLYWIQAHAGTRRQEKKRLRQMANSAIRHGAR